MFFGEGPGFFKLTEDLGFADDHGVEGRGDAEEVTNGVAVFEVVEVGGFGEMEEAFDAVAGVLVVVCDDDDFDAVAGGED